MMFIKKHLTYANNLVDKLLLRDAAWVCVVGAAGEWVHDLRWSVSAGQFRAVV